MEPGARRDQAVRRELETILSSHVFIQSKRLTEFLRFVVERRLDGKDDGLKETLFAVEVFGVGPDSCAHLGSSSDVHSKAIREIFTSAPLNLTADRDVFCGVIQ
jgi:hypothetical protein